MVHFLMRYLWALAFLIGMAAAWRFGDMWWGLSASILLLVFAMFQSHRLEQGWRVHQILCYLSATALSLIAACTEWFPCSAGCSKGEIYSLLFGYNTLYFAAGAYGLASLVLLCYRRALPNVLTHAMTWLLFGNSLLFLGLSAWLQMVCPLCLAVHSCILAATIFVWPMRGSIALCALWTLVGAAIVGSLFAVEGKFSGLSGSHGGERVITPQQNPDNPFMQLPTQSNVDQAFVNTINNYRTIGAADAPYTLSIFIRLGCNHCASWVPQIIKDAETLTADKHINIRFHYVMNRFSEENLDRHYLALSAAYDNKFLLAQTALLGHEADAIGYAESLSEFDIDAATLRQRISTHQAEFDTLRQQDAQLFEAAKSSGTTPAFHLYAGDTLLQQWDSEQIWQDIKTQLADEIAAHKEH